MGLYTNLNYNLACMTFIAAGGQKIAQITMISTKIG